MKPLSYRTSTFTDSVIRRMTRISAQYDAINLSQGFPDFDPPKALLDRLAKVGVGAVPGSSFFREPVNNYIRFHFAKKDETLLAALDRLSDIRSKMV